jgi:CubicO group peptidase (beta-lactamase class C family)
MQKLIYFFTLLLWASNSFAQTPTNNLYFPPKTGNTWATTPIQDLGFCAERIDSLYTFLATNNTKSFVLLKDGKIVLEKYFGSYTVDSLHYWASAGKSLTAFLVGQAQDENLLATTDKSSLHLGNAWTSLPLDQEDKITLWHQLSMTTGLDDNVPNSDCITPNCLIFKAEPGTRWAYHNAPYRLLLDVVANASGVSIQQFTKTRLLDKIGMKGFWFNYVQYGRARDMARFGLLMLAKGVWNGDTILHDTAYYNAMIQPSQTLNKSYGQLWWLNGQASYMIPTVQFVLPGKLCPNAPDDMYAALGKDDQKIHVVPSKGWVVIRQGDSANSSSPVPIEFDNKLWAQLNALDCTSTTQEIFTPKIDLIVAPTITQDSWLVQSNMPFVGVNLYNTQGQCVFLKQFPQSITEFSCAANNLPAGMYHLMVTTENGAQGWAKMIKI